MEKYILRIELNSGKRNHFHFQISIEAHRSITHQSTVFWNYSQHRIIPSWYFANAHSLSGAHTGTQKKAHTGFGMFSFSLAQTGARNDVTFESLRASSPLALPPLLSLSLFLRFTSRSPLTMGNSDWSQLDRSQYDARKSVLRREWTEVLKNVTNRSKWIALSLYL